MVKNKKATMNPKNNGDDHFQYALTALNYQNILTEAALYRSSYKKSVWFERDRLCITPETLENVWIK